MNSYVRPKVADYVNRLQSELQSIGAKADVNILRSDAGLMTTREAARNPIYAVLSGPSGGVAGALFVASKAGFEDILTFDMGGTSTDVALLANGECRLASEAVVHGYPIKAPMLDIHTVGAGGGSIAHVDTGGLLKVGPRSAGADPGPVCYDRGNAEPHDVGAPWHPRRRSVRRVRGPEQVVVPEVRCRRHRFGYLPWTGRGWIECRRGRLRQRRG